MNKLLFYLLVVRVLIFSFIHFRFQVIKDSLMLLVVSMLIVPIIVYSCHILHSKNKDSVPEVSDLSHSDNAENISNLRTTDSGVLLIIVIHLVMSHTTDDATVLVVSLGYHLYCGLMIAPVAIELFLEFILNKKVLIQYYHGETATQT